MATFTNAGLLGNSKRVSADTGDDLTTSTTYHIFPDNIKYYDIDPDTFSAGTVKIEMAKIPYAVILFTTDDLATAPTDYSQEAQDSDTVAMPVDAMPVEASGGFIYVGSHVRFKGARVAIVDAQPNGAAGNLTVKYWNGTALADITATDGTDSGTGFLDSDGNVTWTDPGSGTWVKGTLTEIESLDSVQQGLVPYANHSLYWTKWEVSIALDASVDLESLFLLSNETPIQFRSPREAQIIKQYKGYSGFELATDAGTVTVSINAHSLDPSTELE